MESQSNSIIHLVRKKKPLTLAPEPVRPFYQMDQHLTNSLFFSSLRFVLVEPNHPGNVGMVARALKNMGFSRLILVRPRISDVLTHDDAFRLAGNAEDVLLNAQAVDSVDEALKDCRFACAVTSRFREFSPPLLLARDAASLIAKNPTWNPALVFGGEKYGLPNEIVEKCHALISIPANPQYPSLNLAQAVQILAYECRMALPQDSLPEQNVHSAGFEDTPATVAQVDGMISHLEEALKTIEFLNDSSSRSLIPRLRRLFARSRLETDEVNMLRGLARRIIDRNR